MDHKNENEKNNYFYAKEESYRLCGLGIGIVLGILIGQFVFNYWTMGMCIGMIAGYGIGDCIKMKK